VKQKSAYKKQTTSHKALVRIKYSAGKMEKMETGHETNCGIESDATLTRCINF
jgi:hypothetical protein